MSLINSMLGYWTYSDTGDSAIHWTRQCHFLSLRFPKGLPCNPNLYSLWNMTRFSVWGKLAIEKKRRSCRLFTFLCFVILVKQIISGFYPKMSKALHKLLVAQFPLKPHQLNSFETTLPWSYLGIFGNLHRNLLLFLIIFQLLCFLSPAVAWGDSG